MNKTTTLSVHGEVPVASLDISTRGAFITRTYTHLLGAILAFALIEIYLFDTGIAATIANVLLGGSWAL